MNKQIWLVSFLSVICCMTFAGLSDGLIAYYPFDGNANDYSGNMNNATISNVSFEEGFVRVGELSGSYVALPTNVDQFRQNDFTIAFWFRTTAKDWYFDIAGDRSETQYGNYLSIRMTGDARPPSGRVAAEICDGTSSSHLSCGNNGYGYNDGQWHYLVVARDDHYLKMYIDGVLDDSDYGSVIADINNTKPFKLGRTYSSEFPEIPIQFDELRIYNRTISDTEVRQLYISGSGTYAWETRAEGNEYYSINRDDDDYDFDSIYTDGIRLNTELDSGSPDATYTFIVPPSSGGTYESLEIIVNGDGHETDIWGGAANFWINGIEQDDIEDGLNTTSVSTSYIVQKDGYAEINVTVEANGVFQYDLDYIEVRVSMDTDNLWLDYYMREIGAYMRFKETAALFREWEFSAVYDEVIFDGFMKAIAFAKELNGVGSDGLIDALKASNSSINAFYEFVYSGVVTPLNWLNVQMTYDGLDPLEQPEDIADWLEADAVLCKELAAMWLSKGSDGSLDEDDSELLAKLNALSDRFYGFDSNDGRWQSSEKVREFVEGWSRVNNVHAGSDDDIWEWVQAAFRTVRPMLWYNDPTRGSASYSHDISKSFLKCYSEDLANQASSMETRVIGLSGNLSFGSVTIGATGTKTLSINNAGNSTLTISSIDYPSGFSGNWSGGTISSDSSRDVTVTFSPTAETSYGGTITINSDKTSGLNTHSCSGTGTPVPTRIIELSGNMFFGNVKIDSSKDKILTISNTGNSDLTVTSISYPSGFSGNWSGGTIDDNDSKNVTVTFSPTDQTSYGGNITVTSDKTSGTNTRACSGSGIALTSISISGATSVFEYGTATYSCTAQYSDSSTEAVAPSWSDDSAYAEIDSLGVLSTTGVNTNTNVLITATYSGEIDTHSVLIKKIPATLLDGFIMTNTTYSLSLESELGLDYILQQSTNLSSGWADVSTLPGTGTNIQFDETTLFPDAPSSFFRVVIEPAE